MLNIKCKFFYLSVTLITILYFSEVSDLDTGLLLELWEKV